MAQPPPLRNRSLPVAMSLGITTTISYGTLYYAFGVVAPEMARDTGLSLTWVYGLFSASLFSAALVAPFTGRALDRFGAASVMAAGSAVCAVLLYLFSLSTGPASYGIFLIAIQMAATTALYDAAFTTVARHVAGGARRTVTIITLIAGFASTIFWPLTAWLGKTMSWREIYTVFALLQLLVNLPLHLWLSGSGIRKRPRQHAVHAETIDGNIAANGPRRQVFLLMLTAFAGISFTISSVHLHLIGLLGTIGLGATAPLIGALIGPAQVFGRLVDFFSGGRTPMILVLLFSTLALPAALVLLAFGPSVVASASLAAIIFGLGQGMTSITRGVLPLELFGSAGYGALVGKLNAASLIAMAMAPVITAAVRESFGPRPAILLIACVGATATLSAFRLWSVVKKL